MAEHNVIIWAEDAATYLREILQAAGYEVIVSDSAETTTDLISSFEPLALIVGDCIHDPGPDRLPESIYSHNRPFPVIHWTLRNTEEPAVASFSSSTTEHLLMVLAAIAAISSSYLSRASGWGEAKSARLRRRRSSSEGAQATTR